MFCQKCEYAHLHSMSFITTKFLLSSFRGVDKKKKGLMDFQTDWLMDWLTNRLTDWLIVGSKTLYPSQLVAWDIIKHNHAFMKHIGKYSNFYKLLSCKFLVGKKSMNCMRTKAVVNIKKTFKNLLVHCQTTNMMYIYMYNAHGLIRPSWLLNKHVQYFSRTLLINVSFKTKDGK